MKRVGSGEDFAEGMAIKVELDGFPVVVVRIDGELFAIGDTCSHAKYSLAEGEVYLAEHEIECWKHGSTFSLRDGRPTCLPATRAVPVLDVFEIDGDVFVQEREHLQSEKKRSHR